MPLLFSYGTLQQDDVQLATYGRLLKGEPDALVGYEPATVPIDDPAIALRLGKAFHHDARNNGRADSLLDGRVFVVTDAELANTDAYESAFDYTRVATTLKSGRPAWVYVHHPAGNKS